MHGVFGERVGKRAGKEVFNGVRAGFEGVSRCIGGKPGVFWHA